MEELIIEYGKEIALILEQYADTQLSAEVNGKTFIRLVIRHGNERNLATIRNRKALEIELMGILGWLSDDLEQDLTVLLVVLLEQMGRSKSEAKQIVSRKWIDGENYKEHIHKYRAELCEEIISKYEASDSIAETIDYYVKQATNKYESIYATEETRVRSRGMLPDSGKYRLVATIDDRTCGECLDMDGQVFLVEEAEEGVTLPPFHTNCRCGIEVL